MKNGNLGGFLGGLVGLAVSIYIIGYAWRASQSRKSGFIPGASSEPGAATPLQPNLIKPFSPSMPRVDEGKSLEQLRQENLAMQDLLSASRNQNRQADNMNADGFFDGVYN